MGFIPLKINNLPSLLHPSLAYNSLRTTSICISICSKSAEYTFVMISFTLAWSYHHQGLIILLASLSLTGNLLTTSTKTFLVCPLHLFFFSCLSTFYSKYKVWCDSKYYKRFINTAEHSNLNSNIKTNHVTLTKQGVIFHY